MNESDTCLLSPEVSSTTFLILPSLSFAISLFVHSYIPNRLSPSVARSNAHLSSIVNPRPRSSSSQPLSSRSRPSTSPSVTPLTPSAGRRRAAFQSRPLPWSSVSHSHADYVETKLTSSTFVSSANVHRICGLSRAICVLSWSTTALLFGRLLGLYLQLQDPDEERPKMRVETAEDKKLALELEEAERAVERWQEQLLGIVVTKLKGRTRKGAVYLI